MKPDIARLRAATLNSNFGLSNVFRKGIMNRSQIGAVVAIARKSDLTALGAIEIAAAKLLCGYAPATVLNEVTSEQDLLDAHQAGRLWVALVEDVPVGFALVTLIEKHCAHLQELNVDPVHGRQGFGRALVTAVCEWADSRGLEAVTLTTFRYVAFNMPFYAHVGFEEIPGNELSPVLAEVLQDEARRGLESRVAMRRCFKKFPGVTF
jgi:GNAT superfamily N-acetyltransferase